MIEVNEFTRRGLGHDASGVQEHDTRAEKQSFADIVGDDDDSFGKAAGEIEKSALQFGASNGVESAKRFVHQKNGGIGSEGARDADALALTTGEFAGEARRELRGFETNEAHDFGIAGSDAIRRPTFQTRNQADILLYGEMRQQADFLDDIANAAAKLDGIPVENVFVLDEEGAGGEQAQTINEFEESSFAAAAATEKSDCFAMMDLERNGGENRRCRASANLVCHVL